MFFFVLMSALNPCCSVDLIVVTLACENDISKLVEGVTVAYVDAEKRIGDSLVQIWKLKFVQTLSTGFGQDFEFRRDFEAIVW